jgi:hypothetical protein
MYSDVSLLNGDGCLGCAKILLNEKRLSGETMISEHGELAIYYLCSLVFPSGALVLVLL